MCAAPALFHVQKPFCVCQHVPSTSFITSKHVVSVTNDLVQAGSLADTVQAVTALSGLPSGLPAQASLTEKPCIQQRLQDCTVQLLAQSCSSKAWLDHLQLAAPSQPLLSSTAAEPLLSTHACTEAVLSQLMPPSASAQAAVAQQTAATDTPIRAHPGTDHAEGQPMTMSGRATEAPVCTKASAWLSADTKRLAPIPSSTGEGEGEGAQNSIALAKEALLRIKDASQPRAEAPVIASVTAAVQTDATQALTASGAAQPSNTQQDGAWLPGKTEMALSTAAQLANAAKHQDGAAGSAQLASSDKHPGAGSEAAQLVDASKQRKRAGQPAQAADVKKQNDRASMSAHPADAVLPQDALHQPSQLAKAHAPEDSVSQPAQKFLDAGKHQYGGILPAQLPKHASQRKPSISAEAELDADSQNHAALVSRPPEDPIGLLLHSLSQLQAVTLKAVHTASCCQSEPPMQLAGHRTQGSADPQAQADSQAGPHLKAMAEAQAKPESPAQAEAQALADAPAEAESKPKMVSQAQSASQNSARCSSRLGDLSKLELRLNKSSRTRLQQLKEEAGHVPRRRSYGDTASADGTWQCRPSCQPASSRHQPARSGCAGQKRKHSMTSSGTASRRKADEVSWAGPDADTGHLQAVRRYEKVILCQQYVDHFLRGSWSPR